ncbi:hypothetical protein D3C71_1870780 [compost metagenome]
MVKYSRSQSTLSPMRRICVVMVLPDCSFHSQTLLTKFLRASVGVGPMSWRLMPCSCSWRSTTICVAMPAWSVPGTQVVLKPFMRW